MTTRSIRRAAERKAKKLARKAAAHVPTNTLNLAAAASQTSPLHPKPSRAASRRQTSKFPNPVLLPRRNKSVIPHTSSPPSRPPNSLRIARMPSSPRVRAPVWAAPDPPGTP